MSTQRASDSYLDSYLESLRIRGSSVNYVNKVAELLQRYVAAAKSVSPATATRFLSRYRNHKPNTQARYATYIRGFLTFLGMPFDLKVKVPRQLPPFVSAEDIARIRTCIENKETHKTTTFRDLVLLETASKTGLRRSELANLKVKHIDFRGSRLIVVGGKGGKDRVVPLVLSLAKRLKQLCDAKGEEEKVFGLTYRSLGMKFYIWAKKADVNLHTHSFRHHFATSLVDRGANIRAVQELLGHSNLNTTQVYLAVTGRHLDEAITLLE